MHFEWDDQKAETNLAKHGVSFASVRSFEFETALVWEDDRADYGELRMVALGLVGTRVHQLVYTMRGDTMRVISLRKANARETKTYVENL